MERPKRASKRRSRAAAQPRARRPSGPGAAPAKQPLQDFSSAGGLRAVTTADQIVLEIRRLIAASIFFNARAADEVGMGLTDLQLLHLLQLHGPLTPGQLAAGSGLSSGGVTVALDRLAAAGYVRREPNPADRRSLLVTILPRRLQKVAAMYSGMEAQTRSALETLSESDREAALRMFRALAGVRAGGKAQE
jgi:DNA-binding MarR family transcriptional regulator